MLATHKKVKILAGCCGLHKGEWNQAPPIYDKITKDGRTKVAVRDAMERTRTLDHNCGHGIPIINVLIDAVSD